MVLFFFSKGFGRFQINVPDIQPVSRAPCNEARLAHDLVLGGRSNPGGATPRDVMQYVAYLLCMLDFS